MKCGMDIESEIDRYSDMVMRIAFHSLNNWHDAEDIVEETFIKLYSCKNGFETEEHKKAWLIRITINMCKTKRNSAWFRRVVPLEDNIQSFDSSNTEIFEEINKLSLNQRNAVYLYYIEGYSIEEIAKILKRNKNTIASWVHRAREKLRLGLGGEADED